MAQILSQAGIVEILEAVVEVLTANDGDICEANYNLLKVSIKHGLVREEDCNVG